MKSKPEKIKPTRGLPPLVSVQMKNQIKSKQQNDEYKNIERQLKNNYSAHKPTEIPTAPVSVLTTPNQTPLPAVMNHEVN